MRGAVRVGYGALLLALLAPPPGARAQPTIALDPYAGVNWATDLRLKAQFHDHTHTNETRISAYDDAGYNVVSMFNYSGNYLLGYAWTERRWPPEDWMDPEFLATLQNVDFFIPSAEEVAYAHLTSPFLTIFIDRWDPVTFPVQQPWQYTSTQEGIDLIATLGGLPILAHPWGPPGASLPLERYHALEVHNGFGLGQFLEGGSPSDLSLDLPVFWDLVLSEVRRVFGVAVNDWWGPWRTSGPAEAIDSGKTIVMSHAATLADFRDAFERGAMFAVRDVGITKDQYPAIAFIVTTATSISIATPDTVTWIADGVAIATGITLPLSLVPQSAHYVRAEVSNADGSIVFTQPFFLEQFCGDVTDDGVVDGLDVDAYRAFLASPTGAPFPPAGTRKCTVLNPPVGCDLLDAMVLRRAVESPGLAPGIAPVCEAANL